MLDLQKRPLFLKIKLDNLIHNLKIITQLFDNANILAIIKANAYGHGSKKIAKTLHQNKINYFGVACSKEASEIFKEIPNIKILNLGKFFKDDLILAEKYQYYITISSFKDFQEIIEYANANKKIFNIQVKFDTGMGRVGFFEKDTSEIINIIQNNNKFLKLTGVFTHFPSADFDFSFSNRQIYIFKKIKKDFINAGFENLDFHGPNSDAIINNPKLKIKNVFNVIRPGIMLYGSYWDKEIKQRLGLKPVMEFYSKIVDIKNFNKGDSIGYGRTFIIKKNNFKAALIPVGYADGYLRSLSNKGYVLINNNICNIIGRISMDWIMVDVDNISANIGDNVILFGDDDYKVDIDDLSKLANTISYEILCRVGQNFRKEYVFSKNF